MERHRPIRHASPCVRRTPTRVARARVSTAALALGALLLQGCGVVMPRVTPEFMAVAQRRDPVVDQPRMEVTRELIVNRCASCHSLDDPHAFNEDEWHTWVRKMARKAKLDAAQEHAVLTFILTARELPPPP